MTIQEIGKASQRVGDTEVLLLAAQDKRAVLTLNRRHFHRLHRTHPEHAGIVACTEDLDHSALAARIDDAINMHRDLSGRLILVYRPHR